MSGYRGSILGVSREGRLAPVDSIEVAMTASEGSCVFAIVNCNCIVRYDKTTNKGEVRSRPG